MQVLGSTRRRMDLSGFTSGKLGPGSSMGVVRLLNPSQHLKPLGGSVQILTKGGLQKAKIFSEEMRSVAPRLLQEGFSPGFPFEWKKTSEFLHFPTKEVCT